MFVCDAMQDQCLRFQRDHIACSVVKVAVRGGVLP